jgi:hypothetical protein
MGSQRVLLGPLHRRDPDRVGPYVLLGRLGAGSMGRVYLGKSAAGRLVAVKTIKSEYAEEANFRARFAQEVAIARQVSGVFTAAVVAADPDAEVPWLATGYVPAPTLAHLVDTCGPLPVPVVRWLAAGCAEALESIHDAGLIHRDLKPSNVLVSLDGPRVIDFGVARAVERVQLTTTHGTMGTPAYMAPEQARDTRQATTASDVFSLGSTLLFAATGHAPYQGETVTDVLVQLVTEAPDLSGLPRELSAIVTGCLDRDPGRRPTPAEMVADLAPYVDTEAGREFGPASLPDAGRALIQEYQQRPQPLPRVTGPAAEEEVTVGSQPARSRQRHVPVPARPPALGRRGRRRNAGGGGWVPAPASRLRSGRAASLSVVMAIAAVVVVLVGIGGLVGVWIDRAGNRSTGSQLGASQSVPPDGGTDPRRGGPGGPDWPGGPGPQPPFSGESARPGGPPTLKVNQPRGDGYTSFVLYGSGGWVPGQRVTVTLDGHTSPVKRIVDKAGTFSYTVNQQSEFFKDAIPPGRYRAVATAGGARAEASFTVDPFHR